MTAGPLAIVQNSEGLATGHFDTGFSSFSCAQKQMLRWFPRFQVATTCFSFSPPDLNLVVNYFIFCIHVKLPHCHRVTTQLQYRNNNNNNNNNIIIIIINSRKGSWSGSRRGCYSSTKQGAARGSILSAGV